MVILSKSGPEVKRLTLVEAERIIHNDAWPDPEFDSFCRTHRELNGLENNADLADIICETECPAYDTCLLKVAEEAR